MKSMIINTNKISIDFKDTDYAKGLGVSVQNATEGSISSMGIEYTKDCAVRKDMEGSIVYTGAENDHKSNMGDIVDKLPADKFDPADFISQSMTGKDAQDIEEDGSILEEYVASSLERAVERVKVQRRENQESVDKQIEKAEGQKEYFDEIDRRIKEAAQMAAGIEGMSEAAAKYFLKNELPVTPANIKGSSAVAGVISEAAGSAPFDEVKPQVEAILNKQGMSPDEDIMAAAEWLYEEDVPVTAENIRTYQAFNELKEASPEILMERIVDEVMDGVVPEGADLTNISRDEAAERLENLRQTDEQTICRVFPSEAEQITARRQLEEIRLTMTIDAARAMENKGIDLDVKNLVEIVEELKKMEQDACRQLLQEAGLEAGRSEIGIAAETLRTRADILSAPAAVYGKTIATATEDTLADIASAGNELRAQMEAAGESYESVGTEVRRDLGDSIYKAFSNVDDILDDLGLHRTAANERAVRILAYNRMELTRENIVSMKEYDDRVTTLVKGLKPQVVAELIRRQENPLEMNLEELSDKVSEISEEIMQEDISFRKYLWKLDHSGGISEEERKSMIGIYRLLDKVEKSDGAVVGQVVKEGRELSFSSLLSAVRTQRSGGIDERVDDEFGGLKEVITSGESIRDQISAAFGNRVVSRLQKELSPAVLKHKKDTYMEESLEVVLDDCINSEEALEETSQYYEELAAEVRGMAAGSDGQVISFLKQLDVPDSLVNIQLMKAYLESGARSFLKCYSKEESEKITEVFDDPEELQTVYEEADQRILEQLEQDKAADDIDSDTLKEIALMANSVSFYRQMRTFQKYEVPVVTERGVTTCSVTVKQGREFEKGTVEITMESDLFGKIQATFKVANDRVCGFVTSDEDEALEISRDILNNFKTDLEMNGFTMERGDLAKGKRNSFHSGSKIEETATNQRLYQVAKLFIQNVKRREDEE